MFDQNGYHLTEAEQAFLDTNGYETVERRGLHQARLACMG